MMQETQVLYIYLHYKYCSFYSNKCVKVQLVVLYYIFTALIIVWS